MKRRCCETFVLIVLVLALSSFMAREQGSVYHVAVDGLSIGMTEDEVVSMKGEGVSVSINGETMSYKNGTYVNFDQERRVKEIGSRSLVLNGSEEVRAGTPWRELRARLGRPSRVAKYDGMKKTEMRREPMTYFYREFDLEIYCEFGEVVRFTVLSDDDIARFWGGRKGGWFVW